jgi:hypothetical protein
MCVAAVAVDAAQCEGLTQKGERCKREPAEGSKFCIGHADQAKKNAKPEAKESVAPKGKAEPKEKPASKESVAPKDKTAPKQKAVVEQKDDGTCWAVTEAGTRCKHKKDGESDYCKQHAVNVKPSEPVTQCRAMTYEGTQCTRKPEEGKRYCKQHMGK